MRRLDLDIKANSESWLLEEYVYKQRGVSDIASECGVSDDSIRTRLRRFSIPLRNHRDALAIRNSRHPNTPSTSKRLEIAEARRTGRDINCEYCGVVVYVTNKSKQRFCSRLCLNNYRLENRKRDQLWRYWPEYREWRSLVYQRDSWRCRICGSRHKINAHHILEAGRYESKRFDMDNGVTLCEEHHIQVHSPTRKGFLVKNPNIGGSLEVGNPEASIIDFLRSLIRSND